MRVQDGAVPLGNGPCVRWEPARGPSLSQMHWIPRRNRQAPKRGSPSELLTGSQARGAAAPADPGGPAPGIKVIERDPDRSVPGIKAVRHNPDRPVPGIKSIGRDQDGSEPGIKSIGRDRDGSEPGIKDTAHNPDDPVPGIKFFASPCAKRPRVFANAVSSS